VIGRLADTGGLEGKSGFCVLLTLPNWSVFVNEMFIQAGIDRKARFRLASASPLEQLRLQIDPNLVDNDRQANWRVIYNHEIAMIQDSGHYQLAGSPDNITSTMPAYFVTNSEGGACPFLGGEWSGSLVVREVRGGSNIAIGLRRQAAISVVQSKCSFV